VCTTFYQNRLGFVENVTKTFWCVFFGSQCMCRYADLQCIHCVLMRTCLARHEGRLYWPSKDMDHMRQRYDRLAGPHSAGDRGVSAVSFMANPLFPVSSHDWFTVISCLIVCLKNICFIALYVVKLWGYENYRLTCRKGQVIIWE